ncbi:MAG: FAD:protein FMN transferase [Planctomycetota bacterium]|jgi:thiamine biosynthesis lipoprotein
MSRKNRDILIAAVTVVMLALIMFFAPHRQRSWAVELDSGHRFIMGTFARIVAVAKDSTSAKTAVEAAFQQLRRIDQLMSDYNDASEISLLNRDAFEKDIPVSSETFEVLQRAVEFSRLSDGAFDITIGPLSALWREAAEANSVLDSSELIKARSRIGYEKLILDPHKKTVRFAVEGMKLDLGGIAKGYGIDKAVEIMQTKGCLGGMVDVGGDIRCFGRPPKGRKSWLIGLRDPQRTDELFDTTRSLLILKLSDMAIATSGDYRRFALIDGQKFSHIIDTKTGLGKGKLSSVTVIAPNATDADALATAVSVMGPEKGLALIESIPDTEAVLIPSKSKADILKTSGAGRLLKNPE